jgi:hypothetical protein
MRKATNKLRKRIYYNKSLKCLFVETKPGSNLFKPQPELKGENEKYNEEIRLGTIDSSMSLLWVDVSHAPAHLFKSYGKPTSPGTGAVLWRPYVTEADPESKKMKLVYITTGWGPTGTRFRAVLASGKLARKEESAEDSLFFQPLENYKVETTIKLL